MFRHKIICYYVFILFAEENLVLQMAIVIAFNQMTWLSQTQYPMLLILLRNVTLNVAIDTICIQDIVAPGLLHPAQLILQCQIDMVANRMHIYTITIYRLRAQPAFNNGLVHRVQAKQMPSSSKVSARFFHSFIVILHLI